MRSYHQMSTTGYVVFELHPYTETPKGIKGMYPAKEWQILARFEPTKMIQKVNNVYKIQGQADKPKYVISPSKPFLRNLPNALFSEQRQMTEYLEGAYGGAGIKNQPEPASTKNLPSHLQNLLLAYLGRANRSLPFSHKHGYILNANRKKDKLIFMDPKGKLFTITARPNSSSTGAGSSSARSKSPSSRRPPSGAGSSIRLSTDKKNTQLVLHHLKEIGRGLYQSLTDEAKAKLKPYMPVQLMMNADQVSRSDLRKAYKRLAVQLHPNKGGTINNATKITQALQWLNNSPSSAGPSSGRSQSPSSRRSPSGAGSSSARSKSPSSGRSQSPSGGIHMFNLSKYNKNDPLVLHHLKELVLRLYQSLNSEVKQKLKINGRVDLEAIKNINAIQSIRNKRYTLWLAYYQLAIVYQYYRDSSNRLIYTTNQVTKITQAMEWLFQTLQS